MKKIKYQPTPLVQRIHAVVSRQGRQAFAVANFGDGLGLTYRGCQCQVDTFCLNLLHEGKSFTLSQLSSPPFFVLAAREAEDKPLAMAIYGDSPFPLLEIVGNESVTGQILVHSASPTGVSQTFIHAVFAPGKSDIFALSSRFGSLLMEANAELCHHLLMCGKLTDSLLVQVQERRERNA